MKHKLLCPFFLPVDLYMVKYQSYIILSYLFYILLSCFTLISLTVFFLNQWVSTGWFLVFEEPLYFCALLHVSALEVSWFRSLFAVHLLIQEQAGVFLCAFEPCGRFCSSGSWPPRSFQPKVRMTALDTQRSEVQVSESSGLIQVLTLLFWFFSHVLVNLLWQWNFR